MISRQPPDKKTIRDLNNNLTPCRAFENCLLKMLLVSIYVPCVLGRQAECQEKQLPDNHSQMISYPIFKITKLKQYGKLRDKCFQKGTMYSVAFNNLIFITTASRR